MVYYVIIHHIILLIKVRNMSANQAKHTLLLVSTEKTIDETAVSLDNVFDLIVKDKEKLRDSIGADYQ